MNRILAALGSALLLCAALVAQAPPQTTCRVTLALVDADTRRPVAGLVRIADAAGQIVRPPELLSRGLGLKAEQPIAAWSVAPPGPVVLTLPRAPLTLAAISGLETEQAERALDLTGKAEARVEIPLQRFADLRARGLVAGNTHLHLMKLSQADADRYLREIPRADGLDVLFVSYLERAGADQDYISNRYTPDDLARLSQNNVLLGRGEEHRHNFDAGGEGYGHVMLLDIPDLVLPVSIGPGIMRMGTDGLPIQRGIDQARRGGATAIWCHNLWGYENVPNWVAGKLDAQNIFDGGAHGSYEDSFYRYLNAGLKTPFSTGTDWFLYDFSRVYVPVSGRVTTQAWLAALKAGRSFITNGPLLEFTVGGAGLGERLDLAEPGAIPIVARAAGRSDFGQLELIYNGRVVRTAAAQRVGNHFAAELRTSATVDGPGWLALRTPPPPVAEPSPQSPPARTNELGQALFAHTSPIYVRVGGRDVFDAAIAEELLQSVERNRATIASRAHFADEEERQRVLAVHTAAIDTLRRWIAQGKAVP